MTATPSAERSQRGKRARNYGYETERMVARWLRANGYPDARTTRQVMGRSGNRTPGDISFHPLVVLEVKGRKGGNTSWPTWCRQAAAEASVGQVPVVVFRTPGVADVGSWECRVQGYGWWRASGSFTPEAWPHGRAVLVDDDGDRWPWCCITFAEFITALRRFDTLDGAS